MHAFCNAIETAPNGRGKAREGRVSLEADKGKDTTKKDPTLYFTFSTIHVVHSVSLLRRPSSDSLLIAASFVEVSVSRDPGSDTTCAADAHRTIYFVYFVIWYSHRSRWRCCRLACLGQGVDALPFCRGLKVQNGLPHAVTK